MKAKDGQKCEACGGLLFEGDVVVKRGKKLICTTCESLEWDDAPEKPSWLDEARERWGYNGEYA